MATISWAGIRRRTRSASSAHEQSLRGVASRLAAQTVLLLLVMLIVLEVVVYVITRQTLLSSLESTLTTRASQPDPTLCATLDVRCGGPGFGGPTRGGGPNGGGGPLGPSHGQGQPTTSPNHGQGQPTSNPATGSVQPRGSTTPVAANRTTDPSDASAVYLDRDLHVLHFDGVLGGAILDKEGIERAIATGKQQCCTGHSYRGQTYLVDTAPLLSNGRAVGAVQTSISEHQYQETMQLLLQALLVVAVLGLACSGGISAVLVRRSLQPVRVAIQRQLDFVADAAHELRTPLAIQRTAGEVAMAAPSVEDLQATVEQMLGENQHLTRLVEDLSLLARTDTDAVAIERSPVDISSLVTETTAELGYLAEAQGVTLEGTIAENIRGTGDILRLRQLLLILLDNALKHTPVGGAVTVRLSLQGGRARLDVADSGPGIPPADLPHIFDRFYQADQARTGEGTGLGLAIAKWIVEAHGGQIHAGNASPHGAVFTVTLPAVRPAAS